MDLGESEEGVEEVGALGFGPLPGPYQHYQDHAPPDYTATSMATRPSKCTTASSPTNLLLVFLLIACQPQPQDRP